MNARRIKFVVATLLLGTTAAQAGGFARSNADIDILYEEGNMNLRMGATYVNAPRTYKTNPVPGLVGYNWSPAFMMPSFAMKMKIVDRLTCAGTYTQPYGGAGSFPIPKLDGTRNTDFTIDEFGLTCALKFPTGKGNFYLLGGGFRENLKYENRADIMPGVTTDLTLNGEEFGYRLGAAYDIPEIAFRTSLMYRSGTKYNADGVFTVPGFLLGSPAATATVPGSAEASFPQQVDFTVQTGIAPGWLAYGAVNWSGWSSFDALRVKSPLGDSADPYHWRDGWTITGGVGHQFTPSIAGAVALTWDRATSTGWELSGSESYILQTQVSYTDKRGGELRAGVGLLYLSSLEETEHGPMNASLNNDWGYAFQASYKTKW